MPTVNPSLLIYTPVTDTNAFVEDITPYATDYQHSIRWLGGYWTADFKLYRDTIGQSMYDMWRSNRLFYDLREYDGGQTTWEGSVEEVSCDDEKGLLTVKCYGYCHSIQHRFNSTTDTGTTDASVWIETLRSTDCEFINSGYLQENTLQVYKAGSGGVWTEMLKVAELSDGSSNMPWKIGVYAGRRLYYERLSTPMQPIGWVRGGIRWRVDAINDLKNHITLNYSDETGADQTAIVSTRPESIAIYGRREEHLTRDHLPTASATAFASAYKAEHCWPYTRAVGSGRNIQVYDSVACNRSYSPWAVQPGIYQDTTMIGAAGYYLGWLSDISWFLVDEVTASADGVSLKTSQWTETDALDAYYDYLSRPPKFKKNKKGRGRNRNNNPSGGSGSSGTVQPPPRTRWNTPTPPIPDPEGSY